MSLMFYNAKSYNQDLCAWREDFPYNNAANIFALSNCTYDEVPVASVQGPFCASESCENYTSPQCFVDRAELKAAVDLYIGNGCSDESPTCDVVGQKYGMPISSWCVSNVTEMQSLFEGKSTFNDDISSWDV